MNEIVQARRAPKAIDDESESSYIDLVSKVKKLERRINDTERLTNTRIKKEGMERMVLMITERLDDIENRLK